MQENIDRYGLVGEFAFAVVDGSFASMKKVIGHLADVESAVKSASKAFGGNSLERQFNSTARTVKSSSSQIAGDIRPLKAEFRALKATASNIDFGDMLDAKQFKKATSEVNLYIKKMQSLERQVQGDSAAEREFSAVLKRQQRIMKDKIALQEAERAATFSAQRQGEFTSLHQIGGSILNPLKQAGKEATTVFSDFDDKMSAVAAVSRSTGKDLERLREKAKYLGATTRFTAAQAAEAEKFLANAGFNAKKIIAGVPATLDLASAGQLGLAESADISSNVLSGLQLKVEDLGHVTDVMALAAASANTNIQQLGVAMSYAAPNAALLGASVEETSAMIGTMSNAGIQSDKAGTAARGAFLKLAKPTKSGIAALAQFGITATDANGNMKNVVDLFQEIGTKLQLDPDTFKSIADAGDDIEQLERISQSAQIGALKDIFGTTGISGAAATLSQMKEFTRLSLAGRASSIETSDYEKAFSSQGLKKLDGEDFFTALLRDAGSYQNALKEIDQATIDIIQSDQYLGRLSNKELSQLSEYFKIPPDENLFQVILSTAPNANAAVGKLTSAMGELGIEFKGKSGAARKMAQVMEDNLAGSFRALASAFEAVQVNLIEPLAPLIRSAVDALTKFFLFVANLPSPVRGLIAVTGGLVAAFAAVSVVVGLVGVTLFGFSQAAATAAAASIALKSSIIPLTGFFPAAMTAFQGTFSSPFDTATYAVETFAGRFWEVLGRIKAYLISVAKTVTLVSRSFLSMAASFAVSPLGLAITGFFVLNALLQQINPEIDLLGTILGSVGSVIGFAVGVLQGFTEELLRFLNVPIGMVGSVLSTPFTAIGNAIEYSITTFDAWRKSGREVGADIFKFIALPFELAGRHIVMAWEKIIDFIKWLLYPLASFVAKIGHLLQGGLAEASPGPTYMIRQKWEYTVLFLQGLLNNFSEKVKIVGIHIGMAFLDILPYIGNAFLMLNFVIAKIMGSIVGHILILGFKLSNLLKVIPKIGLDLSWISQRISFIFADSLTLIAVSIDGLLSILGHSLFILPSLLKETNFSLLDTFSLLRQELSASINLTRLTLESGVDQLTHTITDLSAFIIGVFQRIGIAVSSRWQNTINFVKGLLNPFVKFVQNVGMLLQGGLAEASPGPTYWIRQSWDYTIHFIINLLKLSVSYLIWFNVIVYTIVDNILRFAGQVIHYSGLINQAFLGIGDITESEKVAARQELWEGFLVAVNQASQGIDFIVKKVTLFRRISADLISGVKDNFDFFSFGLLTIASLPLTLLNQLEEGAALILPQLSFILNKGIPQAFIYSLPGLVAIAISTGTIKGIEQGFAKALDTLPKVLNQIADGLYSSISEEFKVKLKTDLNIDVDEIYGSFKEFTEGGLQGFIGYLHQVGDLSNQIGAEIYTAIQPLLEFRPTNLLPPLIPWMTTIRPMFSALMVLLQSPSLQGFISFLTGSVLPTALQTFLTLNFLARYFISAILGFPIIAIFQEVMSRLKTVVAQVAPIVYSIEDIVVNLIKNLVFQLNRVVFIIANLLARIPFVGKFLSTSFLSFIDVLKLIVAATPRYFKLLIDYFPTQQVIALFAQYKQLFVGLMSGLLYIFKEGVQPFTSILAEALNPASAFRLMSLYFRTKGFEGIIKKGSLSLGSVFDVLTLRIEKMPLFNLANYINPFDIAFSLSRQVSELLRLTTQEEIPLNFISKKQAQIFQILATPAAKRLAEREKRLVSLVEIMKDAGGMTKFIIKFTQGLMLVSPIIQTLGRMSLTLLFWYNILKPINKEMLDAIANTRVLGVSLKPLAQALSIVRFIVVDMGESLIEKLRYIPSIIRFVVTAFRVLGDIIQFVVHEAIGVSSLLANIFKFFVVNPFSLLIVGLLSVLKSSLVILQGFFKLLKIKTQQYGDAFNAGIGQLIWLIISDLFNGVWSVISFAWYQTVGRIWSLVSFFGELAVAIVKETFAEIGRLTSDFGGEINRLLAMVRTSVKNSFLDSFSDLTQFRKIIQFISIFWKQLIIGLTILMQLSGAFSPIGLAIVTLIELGGFLWSEYTTGFKIIDKIISGLQHPIEALNSAIQGITGFLNIYIPPELTEFVANFAQQFVKNIPLIASAIFVVALLVTQSIGGAFELISSKVLGFIGRILQVADAIQFVGRSVNGIVSDPRIQIPLHESAHNIRSRRNIAGVSNPFAYSMDSNTQEKATYLGEQKIAKSKAVLRYQKELEKQAKIEQKQMERDSIWDIKRGTENGRALIDKERNYYFKTSEGLTESIRGAAFEKRRNRFGIEQYQITDLGKRLAEVQGLGGQALRKSDEYKDERRKIARNTGLEREFARFDITAPTDKDLVGFGVWGKAIIKDILFSFQYAMENLHLDDIKTDYLYVSKYNMPSVSKSQPDTGEAFDRQLAAFRKSHPDSLTIHQVTTAERMRRVLAASQSPETVIPTFFSQEINSRYQEEIERIASAYSKPLLDNTRYTAPHTAAVEQAVIAISRLQAKGIEKELPDFAKFEEINDRVAKESAGKFGAVATGIKGIAVQSVKNFANSLVEASDETEAELLRSKRTLMKTLFGWTGIPQYIESLRFDKIITKQARLLEKRATTIARNNARNVEIARKARERGLQALAANDYHAEGNVEELLRLLRAPENAKLNQFFNAFMKKGRFIRSLERPEINKMREIMSSAYRGNNKYSGNNKESNLEAFLKDLKSKDGFVQKDLEDLRKFIRNGTGVLSGQLNETQAKIFGDRMQSLGFKTRDLTLLREKLEEANLTEEFEQFLLNGEFIAKASKQQQAQIAKLIGLESAQDLKKISEIKLKNPFAQIKLDFQLYIESLEQKVRDTNDSILDNLTRLEHFIDDKIPLIKGQTIVNPIRNLYNKMYDGLWATKDATQKFITNVAKMGVAKFKSLESVTKINKLNSEYRQRKATSLETLMEMGGEKAPKTKQIFMGKMFAELTKKGLKDRLAQDQVLLTILQDHTQNGRRLSIDEKIKLFEFDKWTNQIHEAMATSLGISVSQVEKIAADPNYSAKSVAPFQFFLAKSLPGIIGSFFKDASKSITHTAIGRIIKGVVKDISPTLGQLALTTLSTVIGRTRIALSTGINKFARKIEETIGNNLFSNILNKFSRFIAKQGKEISDFFAVRARDLNEERAKSWAGKIIDSVSGLFNVIRNSIDRAKAASQSHQGGILGAIKNFFSGVKNFISGLFVKKQKLLLTGTETSPLPPKPTKKESLRSFFEKASSNLSGVSESLKQKSTEAKRNIVETPVTYREERRGGQRFYTGLRRKGLMDSTDASFSDGMAEYTKNADRLPFLEKVKAKLLAGASIAAKGISRYFEGAATRTETAWAEAVAKITGNNWWVMVKRAAWAGTKIVSSLNHGASDVTSEAWENTQHSTAANMNQMAQTASHVGNEIAHEMQQAAQVTESAIAQVPHAAKLAAQQSSGFFRTLASSVGGVGKAGMAIGGVVTAAGFAAQTAFFSLQNMGFIDEETSQSLYKFTELFTLLGAVTGLATPIFSAFGASLGAISSIAATVITGITGIGGAIAGVVGLAGMPLAPLLLGIATVGLALGGLYLAFKNNFLGIQSFVQSVGESIGNALTTPIAFITGAWQRFIDNFGGKLMEIIQPALNVAQGLINALNHNPTEKIPTAWEGATENIKGSMQGLISPAQDVATSLINTLNHNPTEKIPSAWDTAATKINESITWITSSAKGMAASIGDALAPFFESIGSFFGNKTAKVKATFAKTKDKAIEVKESLYSELERFFTLRYKSLEAKLTEIESVLVSIKDILIKNTQDSPIKLTEGAQGNVNTQEISPDKIKVNAEKNTPKKTVKSIIAPSKINSIFDGNHIGWTINSIFDGNHTGWTTEEDLISKELNQSQPWFIKQIAFLLNKSLVFKDTMRKQMQHEEAKIAAEILSGVKSPSLLAQEKYQPLVEKKMISTGWFGQKKEAYQINELGQKYIEGKLASQIKNESGIFSKENLANAAKSVGARIPEADLKERALPGQDILVNAANVVAGKEKTVTPESIFQIHGVLLDILTEIKSIQDMMETEQFLLTQRLNPVSPANISPQSSIGQIQSLPVKEIEHHQKTENPALQFLDATGNGLSFLFNGLIENGSKALNKSVEAVGQYAPVAWNSFMDFSKENIPAVWDSISKSASTLKEKYVEHQKNALDSTKVPVTGNAYQAFNQLATDSETKIPYTSFFESAKQFFSGISAKLNFGNENIPEQTRRQRIIEKATFKAAVRKTGAFSGTGKPSNVGGTAVNVPTIPGIPGVGDLGAGNTAIAWNKTTTAIASNIDALIKPAEESGYELQKAVSEGSPGPTYWIRYYWEKTVGAIGGWINGIKKDAHNAGTSIQTSLTNSASEILMSPPKSDIQSQAIRAASYFALTVGDRYQYLAEHGIGSTGVLFTPGVEYIKSSLWNLGGDFVDFAKRSTKALLTFDFVELGDAAGDFFGNFNYGIGGVLSGLNSIILSTISVGVFSLSGFAPLLLTLGAVAFAAAVVTANFLGIRTILFGLMKVAVGTGKILFGVLRAIGEVASNLLKILRGIAPAMKGDFTLMKEGFRGLEVAFRKMRQKLWQGLFDIKWGLLSVVKGISEGLTQIFKTLGFTLRISGESVLRFLGVFKDGKKAGELVTESLISVAKAIGFIGRKSIDLIGVLLSKTKILGLDIKDKIIESFKSAIISIRQFITDFKFQDLITKLRSMFYQPDIVEEAKKEVESQIMSSVLSPFKYAFNFLKGFIGRFLAEIPPEIKNALHKGLSDALVGFEVILRDTLVFFGIESQFDSAIESVKNNWKSLSNWFEVNDSLEKISLAVKNALEPDSISRSFIATVDIIESGWNRLVNWIATTNFFDWLFDSLLKVTQGFTSMMYNLEDKWLIFRRHLANPEKLFGIFFNQIEKLAQILNLGEKFSVVIESIKEKWYGLFVWLSQTDDIPDWFLFYANIGNLFTWLIEKIQLDWKKLVNFLQETNIFANLFSELKEFGLRIPQLFEDVKQSGQAIITELSNAFKLFLSNPVEGMKAIWESILYGDIAKITREVIEIISFEWMKLFTFLRTTEVLPKLFESLKEFGLQLPQIFGGIAKKIMETLRELSGLIQTFLEEPLKKVGAIWEKTGGWISNAFGGKGKKSQQNVNQNAGLSSQQMLSLPNASAAEVNIGVMPPSNPPEMETVKYAPPKFASGGMISGAGTSKGDRVPLLASPGEYIVNAASTRANLGLLEAINQSAKLEIAKIASLPTPVIPERLIKAFVSASKATTDFASNTTKLGAESIPLLTKLKAVIPESIGKPIEMASNIWKKAEVEIANSIVRTENNLRKTSKDVESALSNTSTNSTHSIRKNWAESIYVAQAGLEDIALAAKIEGHGIYKFLSYGLSALSPDKISEVKDAIEGFRFDLKVAKLPSKLDPQSLNKQRDLTKELTKVVDEQFKSKTKHLELQSKLNEQYKSGAIDIESYNKGMAVLDNKYQNISSTLKTQRREYEQRQLAENPSKFAANSQALEQKQKALSRIITLQSELNNQYKKGGIEYADVYLKKMALLEDAHWKVSRAIEAEKLKALELGKTPGFLGVMKQSIGRLFNIPSAEKDQASVASQPLTKQQTLKQIVIQQSQLNEQYKKGVIDAKVYRSEMDQLEKSHRDISNAIEEERYKNDQLARSTQSLLTSLASSLSNFAPELATPIYMINDFFNAFSDIQNSVTGLKVFYAENMAAAVMANSGIAASELTKAGIVGGANTLIATSYGLVATAVKSVIALTTGSLLPILAIGAALFILYQAFKTNFAGIGDIISSIGSFFETTFYSAWDIISDVFDTLEKSINSIGALMSSLVRTIVYPFQRLFELLGGGNNSILGSFNILSGIIGLILLPLKITASILSAIIMAITAIVEIAILTGRTIIDFILMPVRILGDLIDEVQTAFSRFWFGIIQGANKFFSLPDILSQQIAESLMFILNPLNLIQAIVSLIGKAFNFISEIVSFISKTFINLLVPALVIVGKAVGILAGAFLFVTVGIPVIASAIATVATIATGLASVVTFFASLGSIIAVIGSVLQIIAVTTLPAIGAAIMPIIISAAPIIATIMAVVAAAWLIVKVFEVIWTVVSITLSKIGDIIGGIFRTLWEEINNIWKTLVQVGSEIIQPFVFLFSLFNSNSGSSQGFDWISGLNLAIGVALIPLKLVAGLLTLIVKGVSALIQGIIIVGGFFVKLILLPIQLVIALGAAILYPFLQIGNFIQWIITNTTSFLSSIPFVGGLFKPSQPSPVPGFASGGVITGQGSSTGDRVPLLASPGEYIVNAASAQANLPLLEAINDGGGVAVASTVTPVPTPVIPVPSAPPSSEQTPEFNIEFSFGNIIIQNANPQNAANEFLDEFIKCLESPQAQRVVRSQLRDLVEKSKR